MPNLAGVRPRWCATRPHRSSRPRRRRCATRWRRSSRCKERPYRPASAAAPPQPPPPGGRPRQRRSTAEHDLTVELTDGAVSSASSRALAALTFTRKPAITESIFEQEVRSGTPRAPHWPRRCSPDGRTSGWPPGRQPAARSAGARRDRAGDPRRRRRALSADLYGQISQTVQCPATAPVPRSARGATRPGSVLRAATASAPPCPTRCPRPACATLDCSVLDATSKRAVSRSGLPRPRGDYPSARSCLRRAPAAPGTRSPREAAVPSRLQPLTTSIAQRAAVVSTLSDRTWLVEATT